MDAAKKGGYASGAFNINNMEFVQGITDAAEQLNSPVILAVSQGAIKYAGFENIVSLVKTASDTKKIKVSLHLDHGKDMKIIERCINEGFTSVMIDGSDLTFEENIDITKKVVDMAKPKGISVEGELGRLAGIEDHVSVSKEDATYTDPDEAATFVEKTGVDSLAVAIGTSHGAYKFKGDANLAMDRLTEIVGKVDVPLVLHGASGVNQDHVKIGNYVMVAPQAGVTEDVPDGQIVSGAPGMNHRRWLKVQSIIKRLPELRKKMNKIAHKVKKMEGIK